MQGRQSSARRTSDVPHHRPSSGSEGGLNPTLCSCFLTWFNSAGWRFVSVSSRVHVEFNSFPQECFVFWKNKKKKKCFFFSLCLSCCTRCRSLVCSSCCSVIQSQSAAYWLPSGCEINDALRWKQNFNARAALGCFSFRLETSTTFWLMELKKC